MKLLLSILVCIFMLSCAPQTTKKPYLEPNRQPQTDNRDKLHQPVEDHSVSEPPQLRQYEKPQIYEDEILPIPDTFVSSKTETGVKESFDESKKGGSVTIFAYHAFLDPSFLQLVQAKPCLQINKQIFPQATNFSNSAEANVNESLLVENCSNAPLTIQQLSERRLRLTLGDKAVGSKGMPIGTFDFIEKLSSHFRKHPAEGYAMMYRVKGIRKFLSAEEAVIPGVHIENENSIIVTLERPDSLAQFRLFTPRILPAKFMLGPYRTVSVASDKVILTSNPNSTTVRGYLDTLTVVTDGDKNPILSFILGQYDAVALVLLDDIEYVKSQLGVNYKMYTIGSSRYFLALRDIPIALRRRFAEKLRDQDIFSESIKADVRRIKAVETDSPDWPQFYADGPDTVADADENTFNKPLVILFHSNDIIASRIAQRLASEFQSQIELKLTGLGGTEYQQALLDKNWNISVARVPSTITEDITERCRLASLWFDDNLNEQQRIKNLTEIPLFEIKRYLVCKPDIGIDSNGALTTIHKIKFFDADQKNNTNLLESH